jgi:hypothetical protein
MSARKPNVDIQAACACGAVAVHVAGGVKSMFLCSCRDCRRATGTGHAAVAAFATSDVTPVGNPRSFEVAAASGATTTRYFCAACGTPLFARSSRAPDLTLVPVGLLGDVDWFVPNQLIFSRSHQLWDAVPADLPQHDTYRKAQPDQ